MFRQVKHYQSFSTLHNMLIGQFRADEPLIISFVITRKQGGGFHIAEALGDHAVCVLQEISHCVICSGHCTSLQEGWNCTGET